MMLTRVITIKNICVLAIVASTLPISATSHAEDKCLNKDITRAGTSGDDFISGTEGDDVIHGLGGNDTILGNGGDDYICGGTGDDTIYGKTGNDSILGGDGADEIQGNEGSDRINGQNGDDDLDGGEGDDILIGGNGNDFIKGRKGDDELLGDRHVDDNQSGSDQIHGGSGRDWIHGGFGKDYLYGDDDDDIIFGVGSRDLEHGPTGGSYIEHIEGGKGRDVIIGGRRNAHIETNAGNNSSTGTDVKSNSLDDSAFHGLVSNSGKYVALGDSFSAGDGVRPYEDGTNIGPDDPEGRPENQCRRSRYGWQALLADELHWSTSGGRNIDEWFTYRSCTGGETRHFYETGEFEGEAPMLHHVGGNTELAVLSIGGNDGLFGPFVTDCANPLSGDCRNNNSLLDNLEGRLVSLQRHPRNGCHGDSHGVPDKDENVNVYPLACIYIDIARQMEARNRSNPSNLVIVNYPKLFEPEILDRFGNVENKCRTLFEDNAFVGNVTGEEGLFLDGLADRMNKILAQQVDVARTVVNSEGLNVKITVVDTTEGFAGHGLCTKKPWLNPIIIDSENRIESFHPTERGAASILASLTEALGKGTGGEMASDSNFFPKAAYLFRADDTDVYQDENGNNKDAIDILQVIQETDVFERDNDAWGNKVVKAYESGDNRTGKWVWDTTYRHPDIRDYYSTVRSASTGWENYYPYEGKHGITAAFFWGGMLSLISKDRYWAICSNKICGDHPDDRQNFTFGESIASGNFVELCNSQQDLPIEQKNPWCKLENQRVGGKMPWEGPQGITAVLRSPHDGSVYIFSGDRYWWVNSEFEYISSGYTTNDFTGNILAKARNSPVSGKLPTDYPGITAAYASYDAGLSGWTYRLHSESRYWVFNPSHELIGLGDFHTELSPRTPAQ